MEKRLNIEELLAAGRAGITTLILPRHNEKDLVEVARSTLDKLHIVSWTRYMKRLRRRWGVAQTPHYRWHHA